MKHIESVVKIYFTREYGMFKFLKGNRDLNVSKVDKIVKACRSGINVLKYAPVIVNESMEIIDGQHRFAASRELKENVYYVIQENSDLSIVPSINNNSSKWRSLDFLNSYADLNRSPYMAVREFIDLYPKVSVPTAVKMIHSGTPNSKDAMDSFRSGDLSADFKDYAVKVAEMLIDFLPIIDNPFSSRMFSVATMLFGNGKYDHKLMVRKIQESGTRLENIESTKAILSGIEQIINHRARTRVIIH